MKTERGRLPPVRCGIHRLAALLLAGRAAAAGGTRPGARGQRSLQQQATRPPERQTTPPQQPGPQSALHQVPASLGARPVGSAPRAARSGGIALVALGGSAADSPDAPVEAPTTTTPDGYRSKFLLDMFGLRTSANGTRIEELEDFMPQCLAHLHRVIRRVDRWYTDEQLGVLLSRECDLDQTFLSYEDGFKHREACEEFGADLTKARFEELASGSTKGYLEFCAKLAMIMHAGAHDDRHDHAGGAARERRLGVVVELFNRRHVHSCVRMPLGRARVPQGDLRARKLDGKEEAEEEE
ncbi:unnamed protein product, partial [Prorocentrum cordatum]